MWAPKTMDGIKCTERDYDKLYRLYEARMTRRLLKTLLLIVVALAFIGAIE